MSPFAPKYQPCRQAAVIQRKGGTDLLQYARPGQARLGPVSSDALPVFIQSVLDTSQPILYVRRDPIVGNKGPQIFERFIIAYLGECSSIPIALRDPLIRRKIAA